MPNIDDVFERTVRLDEHVSRIDERVDHLIAAVSATPAAAGHTPPSATDQTTGRTPWDFATAVLMRLGPTTIIVIGLLGSAYFLYSEIKTERLEATRELQISIASAQKQLVENTKNMGDMSATLIENITNMLELNKKVDEDNKAAWAKIEAVKRDLFRSEVDADQAWKQVDARPKITTAAITEQAFTDRADLKTAIDGLEPDKAKALITEIETEFPSIIPFVALQYPDDVRNADTDGGKAKKLLKRLVSLTAKEPEDRSKWKAAIASL